MFSEIYCFKQFLRKNIKMKDFLMFVHKMEKKDEDYMQITYKKNVSISTCLLALHLFTALQQKLITTFTKCLCL